MNLIQAVSDPAFQSTLADSSDAEALRSPDIRMIVQDGNQVTNFLKSALGGFGISTPAPTVKVPTAQLPLVNLSGASSATGQTSFVPLSQQSIFKPMAAPGISSALVMGGAVLLTALGGYLLFRLARKRG